MSDKINFPDFEDSMKDFNTNMVIFPIDLSMPNPFENNNNKMHFPPFEELFADWGNFNEFGFDKLINFEESSNESIKNPFE